MPWEKETMLVTGIFSFSKNVFRVIKSPDCLEKELKGAFEHFVGKGDNAGNQHFLLFSQLPTIQRHISFAIFNLTFYHTIQTFNGRKMEGENAGNQHFLIFPQCFLPFPKQISIFQ